MLRDTVEKLVEPAPVLGGDRLRIAETESEILVGEIGLPRPVELVDRAEDRLTALGEQPRRRAVRRRDTGSPVDDEHDDFRFGNRPERLRADPPTETGLGFDLEAAGIDQQKPAPV